MTYTHDLQRKYIELAETRLQQLKANTGPAEMRGRPYYYVLMAPLAPVTGIDFAEPELYQQLLNVGPPNKSSFSPWMTFEGLLLSPARVGSAAYSYRLCGTDGVIEACIAKDLAPPSTEGVLAIEIERVESDLVELVEDNQRVLKAMSVPPPYVVIAALSGIKDWRLARRGLGEYRLKEEILPLRYEDYVFPPLVLAEQIDKTTSALSPILTRLWHTAGYRSRPTR